MSNLPYTFFGRHDRHTLFVSVEVSSPDGNFDTLGKSFLPPRYELQNQNFYFEIAKTWILHAWSIFFKRAQLTKLWSNKNIFHENPVEVRSFDGIYKKPGLRIRIHFIRIRIQHLSMNTNPDPDPIRIQSFNDQKLKKNYSRKFFFSF